MFSTGSVDRFDAAERFPFLGKRFKGRRKALREFTHRDPDYVFWISPEGQLIDARDGHLRNPPKGHADIVHDHPDYGGHFRGRVASDPDRHQLVVVYCRVEHLAQAGKPLDQFLAGMGQMPIPLSSGALVVSDNADIFGTYRDCIARAQEETGSAASPIDDLST